MFLHLRKFIRMYSRPQVRFLWNLKETKELHLIGDAVFSFQKRELYVRLGSDLNHEK